jgi:mono/diheme cytochrome c family protein
VAKQGWIGLFVLALAVSTVVIGAPPEKLDRAKIPADLDVPPAASARPNPQNPTPENIAEGKKYFTSQCAMCHGVDGKGKGDLAISLGMGVPDFTDAKRGSTRTDGDLFYVLTNGHGDMPGEGEDRLSEKVRWNMILFVRSLAS